MAVQNSMFIFEVVVESVQSLVASRCLVIKAEFADIFALEMKDPKQMHIVIPEPPPLPPEPPGKKGKKKPPKKPKKGKKGKVEAPPPEPVIQAGQSVLFSSNPEFLIKNMQKSFMEVSLWSKEDNFVFIGSSPIPWDPVFIAYLEQIAKSMTPPPVTLRDSYNVFEEGTAKIMAVLAMQVKLMHLGEKVATAFRTLSEDPSVKKCLYTGINSKDTSYICTMKTTDEDFETNCNKIENTFVVDKPAKIVYANYKNAPGANLSFFNDGDYCCIGHADKPPESIYKAPETCPDVDFIIDYVRKIIVSCNDNLRMLTPRPTITPRIKATDIDRLCHCQQSGWPIGKFAERFKREAQSEPCPMCMPEGKRLEGARGTTFDIANIRGPCGKPNCRIARDLRAYIENLVEEDDQEFDVNDIVGPCGSKSCNLAEKIQKFLRKEGEFSKGATLEGLATQCACMQTMQNALLKKTSCDSICSKDCEESESESCQGKNCPFSNTSKQKVYDVYYFTVEHDFENYSGSSSASSKTRDDAKSQKSDKSDKSDKSGASNKYKHCSSSCPSMKESNEKITCSKTVCSVSISKTECPKPDPECKKPMCPSTGRLVLPPSPDDSDVVLAMADIRNQCCVKSCDVADTVKDFIVEGVLAKKKKKILDEDDPCYCDCVCSFKTTRTTTYCGICGGYLCLGEDMKDQPDFLKPHPCPIYHKLYDRSFIKTPNPWPDQEVNEKKKAPQQNDTLSLKSMKTASKTRQSSEPKKGSGRSMKGSEKKSEKPEQKKAKKAKPEPKKVGKFTANVEAQPTDHVEKKVVTKYVYPYPAVPKNMGWNWTAEDIPGMKPRPNWKPGAANKILVRRYRALREGVDITAKKKRAMMQKKKKIEMKPTIVVTKKDGEYTVQMEVFKKYSKERLPFQYPYDDKPPLIYTIGKTEKEMNKIKRQRSRRERRDTARKSRLIQSTFRDKCQEICLKAYNQAIGVLPLPNPNDPDCPCSAEPHKYVSPPLESCSCSEDDTISTSDTDNDEWTIEFSPPAAKYDAKAKHPPVLHDNETQYTYLDYKVKLLSKTGSPVPRFFTGPDGKEECSDLGGFWGPDKHWLEINKDGYIGLDNRWVPMNFIGPDGMAYSAEEGSFALATGQVLKIGVDGYINKDGKWAWYGRKRADKNLKNTGTGSTLNSKPRTKYSDQVESGKLDDKTKNKPSPNDKGDREPHPQSAKHDTKGKKIESAPGKDKNRVVMSALFDYDKYKRSRQITGKRLRVDAKKMAKYREIMQGLQMYEDFYDLRPLMKTNRATQDTFKNKTLIQDRSPERSYQSNISSRSFTRYY